MDRRARCRTLVRPAWKNVREKHARITAVCGDGGWLSMPALAADAEAWMGRLASAEQNQSYTGTFVYERNDSFPVIPSGNKWTEIRCASVCYSSTVSLQRLS